MSFFKDVNSVTTTSKPDVFDIDSIKQALRNLFSTKTGEIPFFREYGINLPNYIFELMDEAFELEVLSEVFKAVERFETRVTIDKSLSKATPDPDNNTFSLELYFTVNGFESSGIFNLQQNLKQ